MTAVAPVGWFGPIPLIGSAKQIAVVANIDGHLELFFIDTKNHLGHSFQTQADGIFWAPLDQLSTRTISQIAAIQKLRPGLCGIFGAAQLSGAGRQPCWNRLSGRSILFSQSQSSSLQGIKSAR
jgi:hypothetical protein